MWPRELFVYMCIYLWPKMILLFFRQIAVAYVYAMRYVDDIHDGMWMIYMMCVFAYLSVYLCGHVRALV